MFTPKEDTKSWIKYQRPSPKIFDATLLHNVFEGSNVESVEVTKEAVMGMSGPTFYYAQVIQLNEIFLWNYYES